ncbi:serine threonine protein kinase [Aspergillus affinis]|uniref:serine threonine protein kinase n=1 Tax=Aspergillus affinis TaxID=1070780 RepID=UPI0022FEAA96|nr:serine threonine protein kinase [Aspergillus affinis]KAI9036452.1 serine threonine protein kinase [Aspergillus affinis]
MRNKRQVWVSLHSRGALSLGSNRTQLGHAAFHWGILVSLKVSSGADCHAYDVTDNLLIDPNSRTNLNPHNGWRFRHNPNEDPERNPRILGMVMIGKVPNDVPYDDIEARLASLPLPDKDVQPVQNRVTWTMAAIGKLQEIGVAEMFDISDSWTMQRCLLIGGFEIRRRRRKR